MNKWNAYCGVCAKGWLTTPENAKQYYVQHKKCGNALSSAVEKEARKRGFANYAEWYSTAPADDMWHFMKTWEKEWRQKSK